MTLKQREINHNKICARPTYSKTLVSSFFPQMIGPGCEILYSKNQLNLSLNSLMIKAVLSVHLNFKFWLMEIMLLSPS
jgi:hypothetical protein